MKVCPICKKSFADDLNFCLDDGGLLVESESYESEKTLSLSQEQTGQLSQQTQLRQQIITNQSSLNRQLAPSPKSHKSGFIFILSLGFLMILSIVGSYLLLRPQPQPTEVIFHPPYYEGSPSPTPTQTPTPKPENYVKVEILGKGTNGRGNKFLTGKVKNISNKLVELWSIELNFYKGDVKIRDSYADLKLKILKPHQTIPIWINIYDTDYTSFKVKEPISATPIHKPEAQIFPPLEFSQTEMKAKSGFYAVSGIVENSNDEKISGSFFVIFYDEKSEIVGIESTSFANLAKGEKTKFEVREYETDMFGKPKTFEVIAISNR